MCFVCFTSGVLGPAVTAIPFFVIKRVRVAFSSTNLPSGTIVFMSKNGSGRFAGIVSVHFFTLFTPHTDRIIITQSIICNIESGSLRITTPAKTETTVIMFENDAARTASILLVA